MKRAAVVVIAVAAALLLAGGGIAVWLTTRPPGAEAATTAFLDALAAGDGAGAVALLADPDDRDSLARALDGATARVTDGRVDSSETDGDDATVAVTFELEGRAHAADVTLTRRSGQWLIVAGGRGTVTATAPLGVAASVAGVTFGLDEPEDLLPAVYTVDAAPAVVLTGSVLVAVLPGEAAVVTVPAALSADATEIARRQLETYQDACTTAGPVVADNCGLRLPWAADLTTLSSIAWRIDERPALSITADGTAFAATGGVVTATATGTTPDGSTASFTYRADDWALRGSVTFSADAMTLAVR